MSKGVETKMSTTGTGIDIQLETMSESEIPILKCVNRQWKILPSKGEDIAIRDPKLKQGYLGDLSKKSVIELQEILKRTERVLNNKVLMSKLKDKGKSLQSRKTEVENALEEARSKEKCQDVPNQVDVHGFEWTGSLTNGIENQSKFKGDEKMNDNEEDMDPLKLMSHHSSCIDHREKDLSRLTDDDPAAAIARELEDLKISDAEQEKRRHDSSLFGEKRNEMLNKKYSQNGPTKHPFRPFRRVDNPEPIPGLVVNQKPDKSKPVICISLEESQKLEKEYFDKQRERDLKLTIEGLVRKNKVSNMCQLPTDDVGTYRDTNLTKHILDSDEEDFDDFMLRDSELLEDEDALYIE